MTCILDWTLPMKLVSPNVKEHWTKPHARSKAQRRLLTILWKSHQIKDVPLPCLVKITRYGAKLMDYDNFVASCKSLIDNIGGLIRPEKARGHADGDGQIRFEYHQEKGKVNQIRISISTH